MLKYTVKGTTIVHANEGDKEAKEYKPGDEIELTEEQAKPLAKHLELKEEGDRLESLTVKDLEAKLEQMGKKKGTDFPNGLKKADLILLLREQA